MKKEPKHGAIWGKFADWKKLNTKLSQLNLKGTELIQLLSERTNKELSDFLTK